MYTSFSYCENSFMGLVPMRLYYLGRLMLATGTDELLADRQPALDDRFVQLWNQVQQDVQEHCRIGPTQALNLTGQLLDRVLTAPYCLSNLRQVSLAEALGPIALAAGERQPYATAPLSY